MLKSHLRWGISATMALAAAAYAQPAATDLGLLPTGETRVSSINVFGGTIVWYQFQSDGATQGQNTYLDIITEGASGDSEIGVYDLFGNRIANDDDDGAGLFSALSFGATSPRPPVGTGVGGNGRDGDLFAGSYYIALGNFNTTFNDFGWDVFSTNTAANNFFDLVFTVGTPPPPPPPPANDNCVDAVTIPANGPFPYLTTPVDISSATPDSFSSCAPSNASVWYKITAAQDGFARIATCSAEAPECTVTDTVLEVYESSDGTCNSLFSIACNDDACGLRSAIDVQMTAGRTYYIYAANYGSSQPGIGANMQLAVTGPTPPPADRWIETGDAGDLPTTAQVPSGSGSLGSIQGFIDSSDADMYEIDICDQFGFSATTVGTTTIDTQLWLFDQNGMGVAFNDDNPGGGGLQSTLSNAFVTAPGTYYLAISTYNNDPNDEFGQLIWANTPFGVERAPDGPGATGTIAFWTGGGSSGAYTINLTGACFPGGGGGCPACAGDYDQSGGIDGDDIGAFFADWQAGAPCADVDGSGGVDGDDIPAFFAPWQAGGC